VLTDVFLVPILDKILLHAPLHGLSAVINPSGASILKTALYHKRSPNQPAFDSLYELLQQPVSPPQVRKGGLQEPRFLGLLPTRDCNMHCRYCDFPASRADRQVVMSQDTCQSAVDAYMNHLKEHNYHRASIHFFGGEPFVEPELVFFAAEYAQQKASEYNLSLHLEASSNGLMDEPLARQVAETFNCIVLSLDGPEHIQNEQRPAQGNADSFSNVVATAKILSDSPCTLILRSCITQESLPDLEHIAVWMADNFAPETICLEPMSDTLQARRYQLHAPDPWEFSKTFLQADKLLSDQGIQCMLSTADLSLTTVSSCPVGHDALIVSPRGEINACYLLKETWLSKDKDMHLGHLDHGQLIIQQADLDRVRSYQLDNKPLCENCFCRFHCAGGCHVNHLTDGLPGSYDDVCIRTRLVSLGKILLRTQQADLLERWLADDVALEKTARNQNDRMESWQ